MNENQRKFGIYVFLSTFSRNLIEVFIPVILYKNGYNLIEILFYYLMANIISLIISYPFVYLSQKYNNKLLSIIGIISFATLQILLNYIKHSIIYLLTIAIFYAIYRRGYWISRRYYNLKIIKKEKISTTYSKISIINQIGVIISAYCGSIILDYINLKVLTLIAILLFFISTLPLYLLRFKHERTDEKIELIKNIKKISKSDIYLFGSYELLNVVKFLMPLYLFIYVKNTYQTIGFINLITNLSLIVFTYMFGKKLDISPKNYLTMSILLTVIIYIIKVNAIGLLLLIISLIEGIVIKMYELSISKRFYVLSKEFEYNNYNLIYEITQNIFRSFVTLLLIISGIDIKIMIYIVLFFITIGVFFNIKNKSINLQN